MERFHKDLLIVDCLIIIALVEVVYFNSLNYELLLGYNGVQLSGLEGSFLSIRIADAGLSIILFQHF